MTAITAWATGSNIPSNWAGIFGGRFGLANNDLSFYFDLNTSYAEFSSYNYGDTTTVPLSLNANGGNVYIGKTTGSFKLDVNGSIGGSSLTLADGGNLAVGTTTGTKIGTAITQKLGFFNANPIVQPSGAAEAAVATTAATQVTPYGYTTQAQADTIITLLNEIRAVLVNLGFMKGSA
jgi:hypothetical protein